MLSKTILSILAAAGLAASAPLAPILQISDVARTIPNKWIVVMKNGISEDTFRNHLGGRRADVKAGTKEVHSVGDFKAYTGVFTQAVVNAIAGNQDIAYIEPDTIVTTKVSQRQANAPWGLARISHKKKGADSYIYDSSAGAGTYVYVIDTGILTTHVEFAGRATFGANFVGDGLNTDGNGHGTHVAGTIGSKTYGVAKRTNLIAVKVLDSSGSGANSGVLAGIQWAVNDAKSKGRTGKALINLSLGGALSQATNDVVKAAVNAGLFVGVAAGNDGKLASTTSPASEGSACTVGATDINDVLASYSNYGSVVDIFAPGTNIISTWNRNNFDTNTISGTSMATPHVVGLAAYLIGLNGASQPGPLCQKIRALSTRNVITGFSTAGSAGSPNYLAYNGNGS